MAQAGWDSGRVTVSSKSLIENDEGDEWNMEGVPNTDNLEISKEEAQKRFILFIRDFKIENSFIYRDQLRSNYTLAKYFLQVELEHLFQFDEELASLLQHFPEQLLPSFEEAAAESVKLGQVVDPDAMMDLEEDLIFRPQVMLRSKQQPLLIRDLHSEHIGKLVVIPGIIISASKTNSKPTQLQIVCRYCAQKKSIPAFAGFQATPLPMQCDSQALQEEQNGSTQDPKKNKFKFCRNKMWSKSLHGAR